MINGKNSVGIDRWNFPIIGNNVRINRNNGKKAPQKEEPAVKYNLCK